MDRDALGPDEVRRLHALHGLLVDGRPLDDFLAELTRQICELVGCRYGTVALVEEDGSFGPMGIHGMTDEQVARIRSKPEGHGVFADLLAAKGPVRIDDIAHHPGSAGFPEHHPEMRSLLGMPLEAGLRRLGMVVLAEPHERPAFDETDEMLLGLIGPVVAAMVANAVMLRDARLTARWTRAEADFTRGLLAGNTDLSLAQLAETARHVAQADLVSILLRQGTEHVQVVHASGAGSNQLLGTTTVLDGTLSETALATGRPFLLTDLSSDPRTSGRRASGAFGPAIVLPLRGSQSVLGTVILCRRRGGAQFTRSDLDTAATFADHATLCFELAAARGVHERMQRLEERHRIARDLHDNVVQRLFATGLSFQQALPAVEGKARERLETGLHVLEETVQEIRAKILSLNADPD